MTPDKIKEMLDACYMAKRIRDLLPELPEGIAPSYIQYLDVIRKLEKRQGKVKISDVSDSLSLPRPGVTRVIKEMEDKGYLKKEHSGKDARITIITITPKGKDLSDKYDRDYYRRLAPYLDSISMEEADGMIQTIQKFYAVMNERRVDIE